MQDNSRSLTFDLGRHIQLRRSENPPYLPHQLGLSMLNHNAHRCCSLQRRPNNCAGVLCPIRVFDVWLYMVHDCVRQCSYLLCSVCNIQ